MLPVVILAGGLATRMRPATERIPKSLLEVAGRPFIHHQLDYLRTQGIDRVVVCVGHLGEMIEAAVGDGAAFGLRVDYSHDGPHLLGTGGALRKACTLFDGDCFVLYGDSYLPIAFAPVQSAYRDSARPALMTVLRNDGRWDRSNVVFANNQIRCYDKTRSLPEMNYIDYGLSVISPKVLAGFADDATFDLAGVFHELAAGEQLAGFEVRERFYEIGSPAGLIDTDHYLRNRSHHGIRTAASQ